MKTLFLLRHAQAGNAPQGQTDKQRPLTPYGEEAMQVLGKTLFSQNLIPDFALCSSALRTEGTLEHLMKGAESQIPHQQEDWLYQATPHLILDALQHMPDTLQSLMIVGHNPTLHTLAHNLAKNSPEGGKIASAFPPGSLAIFQLSISSWQQSPKGHANLTHIFLP